MPRSARLFASLPVFLAGLLFSGQALASPSASIEQVRNGLASSPTTPTPSWNTGNAGASNSHYLESHSIAYRTVMDDLPTDGTVIEIVIGYDARRSGSYALDYLTHFQRLLPHVTFAHRDPEVFLPLDGVTGVSALVTTGAIPLPTSNVTVDPDGSGPEPAASQPLTSMASLPDSERVMTLYGGTILEVSYVTQADMSLATKSSESQVKVRFVPAGPRAVLAWGGHIASRWDWGFNADGTPRSAGGISGSSYHMRLVGWNLGSLGNQDRSMSTDAVFPVPTCSISNLGPFCGGSTNTHTAPSGMESYQWSLFDNTCGAVIVGSDTSTSVVVKTSGPGSYSLLLTTGASGFSKQCQATVTVNAPALADAGADLEACAANPQVQLQGFVSGGNPSWTGGTGVFTPGRNVANPLYTPSAAEIAAGSVTLTLTSLPGTGPCPSASDQVKILIHPTAVTSAGADQTVCVTNPAVQLAGTVSGGASSGTWSGGTGTFNPNASTLNAIYTPSAAEIAAGGVTLTLTTDDPVGPCGAVTDQMHVTINPAATVNAGADLFVCAGAPQAQLQGVVGGGATSGTWSGGAGSYNPNANALNAIYTPSAAEIAAGGVTLTLTTNDPTGPCGPVSDQVYISIQGVATANAGVDQTVCSSSPQVQLQGSVGGSAGGGTWTGGTGTFNPNASTLNAIYTPSAAEIAAGGVTLTLVSNDPSGPCGSASDQMRITINPAATVNAGPDQIVCASSPQVQLQGSVGGGATGGTWSGGAGTFSPKATNLNATYTPSTAEIAAGHVTLTLTASTSGPCPPVSDQVTITIDPVEVVNAGPDQAVCASSPQVQLQGSITGAVTTGTWSGGTGTFNPNANALDAIYTPSPAEIAAGHVTLTLTSSSTGRPCPPVADQMTITIGVPASVNAGPDQIVCAASPQAPLQGTIGGSATSATWSGGAGTFIPNANTLNATYAPTAGEVAAGSVTLTLTTNDPAGPCPPLADQVKITFDKPTVTVADRVTCLGIAPVTLCASPGNGVPPYTYHWSDGETTPCISVSDTLVYTVTITDAKGCQATGSGRFRPRLCQGELTHTSATCSSFESGTAEDFPSSDVSYHVDSNNIITTIAPGVFFYWSKVTAPAADFTIDIAETKSNPAFPFIGIQQGDQITLYDADCNSVGSGIETSPGQGQIVVHGATVGQVFMIGVKYSLKDLIGAYLDPANGCHFDFRTWVNGVLADFDPDGLTIGDPSVTGVTPGTRYMRLFRPMPNPFTNMTQMAYSVSTDQEKVSIRVYDVAGRVVRTLVDGAQAAGVYVVSWNGRDEQGVSLRPGMYFVQARIGNEAQRVRVTFLK